VQTQLQSDTGEQHFAQLVESSQSLEIPTAAARVGFIAKSLSEARKKLQFTIDLLKKRPNVEIIHHPKGIYYRKNGIGTNDTNGSLKVVALFSGQGSQYLEMGREIALNFPPLRQAYAQMDKVLLKEDLPPISDIVFPRPVFNKAEKDAQIAVLQQTENAQPAIGTFSIGLYKILQQAGFKADFVAGHSFGELTALRAADVLNDDDYFFLVQARGQAMASPADPNFDAGAMLAVKGDINEVQDIVEKFPNITIANWNSDVQLVLGGLTQDIGEIKQVLEKHDFSTVLLPVSAAFHTPLVEHAHKPFAEALNNVSFASPKIPVYSNITGAPYPQQPDAIRQQLASHILKPVGFKRKIENMYAAGGYFFIEFGPRNVLTALVTNILADKPPLSYFAVALNTSRKKDSDRQLREAVVQLRVAGLPLRNLDPYYQQETFETPKKKKMTVPLNGANYVTDEWKAAFENALQDGHKVSLSPSPVQAFNNSESSELEVGHDEMPIDTQKSTNDSINENPSEISEISEISEFDNRSDDQTDNQTDNQTQTDRVSMTQALDNHPGVLNQAPFSPNQGESQPLVHQQYLKNMGEYSQNFFQLMQQQYALLTSGKCSQALLDSFERGMAYFHEHQAQMQRVHEQFLKNKADYSQSILQWMQPSSSATTEAQREMPRLSRTTEENAPAPLEPALRVVSPTVEEPKSPVIPTTAPVPSEPIVVAAAPAPAPAPAPAVEPAPAPAPAPTVDLGPLTKAMLSLVSEKTGYPEDMLEIEMDMEADLGIDSIKRVEILGAMQEQFPDLPPVNPDDLAELRTLGEIVEYMGKQPIQGLAEKKTLAA
jgi:acyl transferase domain-containing protein